jgi:hypothetical protein
VAAENAGNAENEKSAVESMAWRMPGEMSENSGKCRKS